MSQGRTLVAIGSKARRVWRESGREPRRAAGCGMEAAAGERAGRPGVRGRGSLKADRVQLTGGLHTGGLRRQCMACPLVYRASRVTRMHMEAVTAALGPQPCSSQRAGSPQQSVHSDTGAA